MTSSLSGSRLAELPLLPTTLVGSYAQPDWLVDREVLLGNAPPRIRMEQVWRVPAPHLEEAQDDATRLAVRDMERGGLDILTDGEIRRESYFNRFAAALDGLSLDPPGETIGRNGKLPRCRAWSRRSRGRRRSCCTTPRCCAKPPAGRPG